MIHVVYANRTDVFPIVIDHIAIQNYEVGGGDGIITDTGGSIYINNVDVVTTGTALKAGYYSPGGSGTILGGTGSCQYISGFGLYVDHSTFTSQFVGNPLTNCDGWTLDITLGQSYFNNITLIGQGIHTMQLGGQNDFNSIYEEDGSTTGFLTWDTSQGGCQPGCGANSFRHVELADAAAGGNQYFINTVNGGSTPLGQVDFESVDGSSIALVGGTTPIASCSITQNGPTSTNLNPGLCNFAAGFISGNFVGYGAGSNINATPNLRTGITNSYSWSIGPTTATGKPGNMLVEQPLVSGNGGKDYFDILDPSNTISSGPPPRFDIDSNFNVNTIGGFNSASVTVSSLPSASANSGLRRTVSDSSAITSQGQTCVGGGSVVAQAFSDGSVWHCSY